MTLPAEFLLYYDRITETSGNLPPPPISDKAQMKVSKCVSASFVLSISFCGPVFFFLFFVFFTKSFLASQEVRNRYKEQYKGVRI